MWGTTMVRDNILHQSHERTALATPSLELLKLSCQDGRLRVKLGINHGPNQVSHLLHPRRILFEQLPQQWLGFKQSIRSDERLGVDIPKLEGRVSRLHVSFENEDCRPHFSLRQETLAISQRNLRVRRVLRIGALYPRRGIRAASF